MDDKDNEQDVNISTTIENEEETSLEEAVTVVTLPSSVRCISSPDTTLSNHSARIYSNSHHTEVRRSTDERDLLLESEENPRRQQYCTFSDSLVRMPETPVQTTSFEKREEDELSRQIFSRSQQGHREPLESIAQPLGEISLQSSTTSTPQQESCGRHFDDPSDGRLENDTQLRRGGLVDGERVQSK